MLENMLLNVLDTTYGDQSLTIFFIFLKILTNCIQNNYIKIIYNIYIFIIKKGWQCKAEGVWRSWYIGCDIWF